MLALLAGRQSPCALFPLAGEPKHVLHEWDIPHHVHKYGHDLLQTHMMIVKAFPVHYIMR